MPNTASAGQFSALGGGGGEGEGEKR